MSGRRVLAITKRLLLQFRRDRRTLALLFVAPLVILGLIGYLLRGGGDKASMGIVDLDTGQLGPAVTAGLHQSSLVEATDLDQARAEQRLADGSLASYVLFPADFTQRAAGGVIAPEIHLEGTQPNLSQASIQALNQALPGALGTLARGQAPQIRPVVRFLHGGADYDTLDYFGAGFIGLVVFFLVYVVTAVAFLRERSQGTLERLMASSLRRSEMVLGYMLGFTALALVQGLEILLFTLYALRVHNAGNVALIFTFEALLAVAAVNLGILLSMFARTEFQAVQFIPLVIVPQLLLSGILLPVATEPRLLQYVSYALPLTYAVSGLREVMLKGSGLESQALLIDLAVVAGFAVVLIAAAAATLKRRVA